MALTEDGLVYADEMYDGSSLGCGRLIRLDIPEARDTSCRSVDGAFMSVVAQGFGRSPDGDDPQRTVVELEGACSAVQPLLPAMVATFG
ncbi:hypothetical protein [Nocardia cyriacigeorgica]|uniref:Uncharacterized protein n=1 Tax=Nocardia cyriacigeorgica TaxID=135487 RepID=A0A4U8W2T8_9NOCA|nr:hypothetical protein [Nocardia cyriacigeorgica]MBF6344254.1 hypothetical protein [Nocardia cyriacigeorgica]VFA99169.1 Uncharacterised protein [Nocardia cyriacigeorgica]